MSEETCSKCGLPLSSCKCGSIPNIEATIQISGKDEIDRLNEENKDLKAKLELVSEKAFENAVNDVSEKLNLSEQERENIKTVEDLQRLKMRIEEKERLHREEHHGAMGKAPLSSESSSYGDNGIKEYDSYEDMIKDLNEREKSEIPEVAQEAKAIKEQLLEKLKKRGFEIEIDILKKQNEAWKKVSKERDKKEGENQ